MYTTVLDFEQKENKMQHSMLHGHGSIFVNNPLYTHAYNTATTIVYSTNVA